MPTFESTIKFSTLVALVALATSACGGDEAKYKPRAAPSTKVTLPAVPNVPQTPIKAGDDYTVWGASYYMRSRVHSKKVLGKKITVVGYITKTNLPDAPECAVHETGKGDPEDCKPPVPKFWIGDSKTAKPDETIQVMGWASNYANIYDAIKQYKKDKDKDDAEPYQDARLAVPIPNPLPNVGAKVKITGMYGSTYSRHTTGLEADPIMGILTYEKLEYIEKPAEPGTLPGMKK